MAGAKTVITETITTSQNIFQIKSKKRKYASFLVEGKAAHLDGMTHYCPKCRVQSHAIASNQGFVIVGGKSIVAVGDTSSCGSKYLKISDLAVMSNGSGSSKTIDFRHKSKNVQFI